MDREVRFYPPWETKIGQMQQVVRVLRRHADIFVGNRGSIIVRCYPYKSSTYMHLVYNLIYATLASSQQFGPMQAPTEIRPILLHYDDNGLPNPERQPPTAFSTIPQFGQQPNWTDVVLVRVRFAQQEPALCFLQNFNRTVGRVFDRRQVRSPFAHPDLSQPERMLRHRLQQICLERNGGIPPRTPRGRHYGGHYRAQRPQDVRYFHNGIQVYKEYPNGQSEPLQFENYTELQYMHVVVASLRKYATMFKQKENSVVIQNIELEELAEADTERITTLVYTVVSSNEFRQRCLALQERNKQRQQAADSTTSNHNLSPSKSHPPAASISSGGTQEFLPARIERLARRRKPADVPTKQKGEEAEGKKDSEGKKNSEEEGKTKEEEGKTKDEEGKTKEEEGKKSEKQAVERPPLVRVQFRSKEAGYVFCQLFKDCQQKERQKMEQNAAAAAASDNSEGEEGDGDSYSDLSDLEEVFSPDEDDGEGVKKKEQRKKKKKRGRKGMCLYFPNSFAHRDLTPPELALGHAMRQFCRERNAMLGSTTTNAPPSTAAKGEEGAQQRGWKNGPRCFYARAGRIFERNAANHNKSEEEQKGQQQQKA